MEVLRIQHAANSYLLFNLSIDKLRELQNDSQALAIYSNHCLQTGQNICIENDAIHSSTVLSTDQISDTNLPSTSTSSITSGQRRRFDFLCGKDNFIYAVKQAGEQWHYFEELDSISSQHHSLPASMLFAISKLKDVRSIAVTLNNMQSLIYFRDGQFIFNNQPLKTCLEIAGKQIGNFPERKPTAKKTNELVFTSGQTNPLLFLKDFEKCRDLKNDKDKSYKIMAFADEQHKGQLTELYFTGDWPKMKTAFLNLYTLSFVENKKKT